MKPIEKSTSVPDLTDPQARDPEGDLTNEARAEFGRAAVDLGTPDRGLNDDRTDAVDAIANILHWIHGIGVDPHSALQSATRHFEAELDTVEEQAVAILNDAGIPAHLEHTGGGIWVAEARSATIPDRYVWITDSEGDPGGQFLLIAYRDREDETGIAGLSGACSAEQLIDRARRGLTEPA